MAEPNTGTTGQEPGAGANGQGQEPANGNAAEHPRGQGQEPAGGQGQEPNLEQLTQRQSALERELAEARREAATYRTQLREREQQGMTEQERLAAERAELEQERNQLRLELQERDLAEKASAVATRLGYRNPALALALLPREAVLKDGKPDEAALEAALKKRLTDDPYLGTGGGDDAGGGRRTGGSRPRSMNELIRGQAARS